MRLRHSEWHLCKHNYDYRQSHSHNITNKHPDTCVHGELHVPVDGLELGRDDKRLRDRPELLVYNTPHFGDRSWANIFLPVQLCGKSTRL